MPRLPRMTAKEMIAVLEKLGFWLSRQSGSHKIYINRVGRRATVPYHGNKILHPKILKRIMDDAELKTEKLLEFIGG